MEKLEKKHKHKLTDLLKVGIFALMLLLPFLIFLPSGCYYGHNEHATATRVEPEIVNFNQLAYFPEWSNNDVGYVNIPYGTNEFIDNNTLKIELPPGYENPQINFTNLESGKYYIRFSWSSTAEIPFLYRAYSTDNNTNIFYRELNTNSYSNIDTFNTKFRLNFCFNINPSLPNTSTELLIKLNIFNLTQMFGSGNEPTIQEFNEIFPNEYYEYTESRMEIINHPESITWNMYYSWEDLWNTPLFEWTNTSILRTGLKNFVGVFGVNDTAYITNLITYELIIVAIYIVIDIVIEIFKWLTHLIGEK